MTYVARINSTPYWEFKFDGVSFTITQGQMTSRYTRVSSSIILPALWKNIQYLGFSISSEIGVYFTELDFEVLRFHWVDFSIPRFGIKMTIPNTFDGYGFNMTVERDEKFDERSLTNFYTVGLLNFVDGVEGGVKRIRNDIGVGREKKTNAYVSKEYGVIEDYQDLHAEVVVYSALNNDLDYSLETFNIFKDIKLVKVSKRNIAAIEEIANITFVSSIYGVQDEMIFEETFAFRSLSCEAFGNPKPQVTIQDKDGHFLPTVELKQTTSMGSHVIASLDNIPLEKAVGNYTCTATAGNKTLTRMIRAKKVVKLEIMFAEIVVNNTEEKSDLGSIYNLNTGESKKETPTIHRWRQYNNTGGTTFDLTSLEDAFHPVILTSAIDGDFVNLTMTYVARINSTPYWEFKFDGVSFTITQGQMTSRYTRVSSSIILPALWKNIQYLGFSISSEIGVYFTELDFEVLRFHWVDFSIPRFGIKMTLPHTFDGYGFNMTVERDEKFDERSLTNFYTVSLLNFVDGVEGGVKRIRNGIGVGRQKKTNAYVSKEYGVIEDYQDLHAEVVVYSALNNDLDYSLETFNIFKDIKLVKVSKRNIAAIEEIANITFVSSIYGVQDEMIFEETFAFRSLSCEAFGNPKPQVTIQDKDGHFLPTVELKQTTSMGSHVIASLDNIPLEKAVGNYTCTATAGNKTLTRMIRVKKVVKPEIMFAEIVVNNTEEIIAVCIAKGQPAPDISFSVNFAADDVIEKRPLLETESTEKMYHTSKYTRRGGLSVNKWYEFNAKKYPKPKSATFDKHAHDQDVTQKIIAIKSLPFLSRKHVKRLFCRADGYDNVYVTKEVAESLSSFLNVFMSRVNKLTYINVFG